MPVAAARSSPSVAAGWYLRQRVTPHRPHVFGRRCLQEDAISGGDPELLKTLAFSTLQVLLFLKTVPVLPPRPVLLQVARSIGQASDGKAERFWKRFRCSQNSWKGSSEASLQVATASIDHTARLWSIDTGKAC